MKRVISILICAAAAFSLHAESVWTGNAAVASASLFTGKTEGFRAASNSFPSGTVLTVTNPRGGLSVDVTVASRLETPGVFILLDQDAAKALNLPTNQVVPVRVSPRSRESVSLEVNKPETTEEIESLIDDIDYNPAAGLVDDSSPADDKTGITAGVSRKEEPSTGDGTGKKEPLEKTPPEKTPPALVSTKRVGEPVAIESYTLDEEKYESTAELPDERELTEPADVPELPDVPVLIDLPEADGPQTEPRLADSDNQENVNVEPELPIDSEKYIYFLSPSDLRPPVADVSEEVPEAVAVVEESIERLPIVYPEPGSRYVQIGAYRNKGVLEDATNAVKKTHSAYPIGVAVEEGTGAPVYRLLIGPLRPAETGIVLQTARNTLFPDAFPYTPR